MTSLLAVRGRRVRLALAWAGGLVVLVAAALVAGAPAEDVPLDPTSPGPNGLLGVVEVLDELGVEVVVSLDPPNDTAARVFVPLDLLGAERRDALLEWARAGGTLVVAGADERLHGLVPTGASLTDRIGAVGRPPDCDLPALADVDEVVHAQWDTLRVPEDEEVVACFGDAEMAWLVVRSEGDGTIVALGSAAPFANRALDEGDNAVLAAALLGPAPGDRLVVVPRPGVGEGDQRLVDLIAERVWHGLALLLAAVLLAVVWRARRLGRPVPENLPPVVPSAELARSIAELLHRAGSRQGAAERLRADARSIALRVLGVPASTPPSTLASLAAERLDIDLATAQRALIDDAVGDDDELMGVARAVRLVDAACRRWTKPDSDISIKRSGALSVDSRDDADPGAGP